MRRHLLAACVLVPAAALLAANAGYFSSSGPAVAQAVQIAPPGARACDSHCEASWMDANLRLDQVQMIGTGESYKQKPGAGILTLIRMGGHREDAQALDYGLPTLAQQLDQDVRALSFDIAHDPKGGLFRNPAGASMAMELLDADYVATMKQPGFKTIHVLDVDYKASCLLLADCLAQVAAWSRQHPRHMPIVITLKTNDVKTPMPGATRPLPFDGAALDALDADIRAAFDAGQLFTPDQLQGDHASLREAAMVHAWPRLGDVRGKVIFVLEDSAAKIAAYQGARKSLEGRAMFVAADQASPLAAFITLPDPRKDGERISDAVAAGFIVKTRADEAAQEARRGDTSRRTAAFASGAQIVETNFVQPDPALGSYRVSLADNPDAMCNPGPGTERCVAFAHAAPLHTATAALP